MSVRNLNRLLAPRSVALIGASEQPGSLGATLLRNLVAGGFKGGIHPVNPKYTELGGLPAVASVAELDTAPDLAVICTPPPRCRASSASWAKRARARPSCSALAWRKRATSAGARSSR
ncbi:CoA-binding protein [Massilia sp. Dwa41.01b]|uniref:CoA-binding protein n=1 Tax=Massilia sp. Dwa41.01b TaxID=2709302 RepID=UPI0028057DD8|nr:CoA-binding protein [Massilia sp. Dwa41.01b]